MSNDAGEGDFREVVATKGLNLFGEVCAKEETVGQEVEAERGQGRGFKDQGCWMGVCELLLSVSSPLEGIPRCLCSGPFSRLCQQRQLHCLVCSGPFQQRSDGS